MQFKKLVLGGVDGDDGDGEVEIIIAGTGTQEEMRSRAKKRCMERPMEKADGGSRGFPRHEAKGGSSIARRLGTRLSTNLSHNQVFLNTALSGVLDMYYDYLLLF